MNLRKIPWAVATALALSACGSGGGDDAAPTEVQSLDLTGQAAKGLIANGTVIVTEVGGGEVGRSLTDSVGRFNLRVSLPRGRPFLVKVMGGNGATHLDEITGTAQTLPASFDMRAAFTQASGSTLKLSVTPFSEMAVVAAERTSGGLTADNIQAGNSTVAQILGFQPTSVEIKPTSATGATADEQKLAVLLAAVSQMAAIGAAGCSNPTPGERAACVVDRLGEATSTTSLRLGNNLGTAFGTAINTVLQQPRLAGNVSSGVLGAILQNLNCTGSACTPEAPPSVTPDPVAAAIAAAKSMLTDLRSDWRTLFVSGTSSGVGDLRAQADKFSASTRVVQAPVEMFTKTSAAFVLGIDLYNDYKAGRTTSNSRGRGAGLFGSEGFWPHSESSAAGCSLYQDSGRTTLATSSANANFIACSTRYYSVYNSNTGSWTEYSHRVFITPVTTVAGQFTYGMRARSRACTLSGGCSSSNFLDAGERTGSISSSTSGGHLVSLSASGEGPPPFRFDDKALYGASTTLSISGARTTSTTASTFTVSGSIGVKDSANASLGTLTVSSGMLNEIATSGGGFELWGGTLNVNWVTASNGFEGSIAATDPVWTKDASVYMPTKASISGKVSNTESGVKTEFITGALTLNALGVAQYDASKPTSATNFFTVNGTFAGSVTAPTRPRLELTLSTGQKTSDDGPTAAVLQYRSVVADVPRTTVTVNATVDNAGVPTLALAEPAKGLSLSVRKGATSADLRLNGTTVIGTLNVNSGVLTFTDGTFMSVEITH